MARIAPCPAMMGPLSMGGARECNGRQEEILRRQRTNDGGGPFVTLDCQTPFHGNEPRGNKSIRRICSTIGIYAVVSYSPSTSRRNSNRRIGSSLTCRPSSAALTRGRTGYWRRETSTRSTAPRTTIGWRCRPVTGRSRTGWTRSAWSSWGLGTRRAGGPALRRRACLPTAGTYRRTTQRASPQRRLSTAESEGDSGGSEPLVLSGLHEGLRHRRRRATGGLPRGSPWRRPGADGGSGPSGGRSA